jgi:hypothetical protein
MLARPGGVARHLQHGVARARPDRRRRARSSGGRCPSLEVRLDRDHAVRAVERDRAGVARSIVDVLDARDRTRAEEADHGVPIVGRLVGQHERHAGGGRALAVLGALYR